MSAYPYEMPPLALGHGRRQPLRAGFPGDPRMTPRGFGFNSSVDPRSNFSPRPQASPSAEFIYGGANSAYSGGPRAGVFLPHVVRFHPPHYLPPPLTPLPIPGSPAPSLTPPGTNLPLGGPPGTYFHPPLHGNSGLPPGYPFINPSALGIAPWPQGPNIPPPDPTDVFLKNWLSAVTASYDERSRAVQGDRPMKARVHTCVVCT